MAIEDWMYDWGDEELDDRERPAVCRYCDEDIWWVDGKPYDDEDGGRPHQCPARIASASDFPVIP